MTIMKTESDLRSAADNPDLTSLQTIILEAKWTDEDHGQVYLKMDVPSGYKAEFIIPASDLQKNYNTDNPDDLQGKPILCAFLEKKLVGVS